MTVYPRLRGGGCAAIALTFGVFGIAAGIEAVHYTTNVGPSGDDFTGLLAIPARITLLGLGVVTLWRPDAATAVRCTGQSAELRLSSQRFSARCS